MSQTSITHALGQATVAKIFETTLEFGSTYLFPDWADDTPVVPLSVHSWLVKNEGKIYLIDAGVGKGKTRASALFNHLDNPYLERLAEQGVTPDQVDYVLMTHIHTDHVGWNTTFKDGEWQPTFPNARYVFPKEGYEFYLTEEGRAVAGYAAFADSVAPIVAAGLADFIPAAGGTVDQHFEYIPTPGHCVGHMSIRFSSEGEQGLFAGDVMHCLEQVKNPQLVSVFCVDKPLAIETRQQILEQMAQSHTLYFSSHFEGSSVGYVNREGDHYRWQPV